MRIAHIRVTLKCMMDVIFVYTFELMSWHGRFCCTCRCERDVRIFCISCCCLYCICCFTGSLRYPYITFRASWLPEQAYIHTIIATSHPHPTTRVTQTTGLVTSEHKTYAATNDDEDVKQGSSSPRYVPIVATEMPAVTSTSTATPTSQQQQPHCVCHWTAASLPQLRTLSELTSTSFDSTMLYGTRLEESTSSSKPHGYTVSEMSSSCVLLVLRDHALLGDTDVMSTACVELGPAMAAASMSSTALSTPVRFEAPLSHHTRYNGFVTGEVMIRPIQR